MNSKQLALAFVSRNSSLALFASTLLLLGASGCRLLSPSFDSDRTDIPETAKSPDANAYIIHSPDGLQISAGDHPEWFGMQRVGADGRVSLGSLGRLRVDGLSPAHVAEQVAEVAGVDKAAVRVEVVEYNSQQIYLHGQVRGAQRSVPYRGPEEVRQLLARCGGLTSGAAVDDVYVIRSRVVDGRPPQVFRIRKAKNHSGADHNARLHLQPFDEIYVGETRQSCLEKCVPPCLRPLFQSFCALLPWSTQPSRVPSMESIPIL